MTDPARIVGRITAIFAIAAGVIHVSAAGDHSHIPVMLVGFLVVAVLQVGLGALLFWRRPTPLLIVAGLLLTVGSVGVWLWSRTKGLSFDEHGEVHSIGFKDGICVLFEILTVPGLLVLFSRDLTLVDLPSARLPTQALGMAAALTFALMVPALLLGGEHEHSHAEAVALGLHAAHGEGGHAGAAGVEHAHGSSAHAQHSAHGGHTHAAQHHASQGHLGHLGSTAGHVHTELAAFHTGHGSTGTSPAAHGQHGTGTGGQSHHRHTGHARHRGHHRRHRGHGHHKGGGHQHGGGGHGGHGDHQPPENDGVLANVCQAVDSVAVVC